MEQIIENLKENVIISEKNIKDIKQYISKKYSENKSYQNAKILANTINSIMDAKLEEFDTIQRNRIKTSIYKESLSRNQYHISAYDVFKGCLKESIINPGDSDSFLQWINNNQSMTVSKNELSIFLISVKKDGDGTIDSIVEKIVLKGDNSENNNEKVNNDSAKYQEKPIRVRFNKRLQILLSSIKNLGSLLGGGIKSPILSIRKNSRRAIAITILLLFICVLSAVIYNARQSDLKTQQYNIKNQDTAINSNELGSSIRYSPVDEKILREWLKKKNSILGEEPYLSKILTISKKYNINPLFMIAITGQEQGFVPKSNKNAKKIARNPFNVYGSWTKYGKNIEDSSEIAARSIINISKKRPLNEDEIRWINSKYAEDKKWWIGVTKIYKQLKKDIAQKSK